MFESKARAVTEHALHEPAEKGLNLRHNSAKRTCAATHPYHSSRKSPKVQQQLVKPLRHHKTAALIGASPKVESHKGNLYTPPSHCMKKDTHFKSPH
jgi:hypothetical protein